MPRRPRSWTRRPRRVRRPRSSSRAWDSIPLCGDPRIGCWAPRTSGPRRCTPYIRATADPRKLVAALMKAAADPALAKKLGTQGQQFKQGLAQGKAQTEELAKSLKNVAVDCWIGVSDSLMYKAALSAALDSAGQNGTRGVNGMTLKATIAMSAFNQPVTVTPPAKALPREAARQRDARRHDGRHLGRHHAVTRPASRRARGWRRWWNRPGGAVRRHPADSTARGR